ncbi:thioesterase family protein [Labrys neptuniae]|uniref:acyl-CoA thioesterase n=1 Tax=Labrys TaxID=204476 RepID=UPI0028912311|nr:thioesterase family protein [Labrys neptuniae]MDT3382290.1 thioesterase family protein [Labrys neptuniae]
MPELPVPADYEFLTTDKLRYGDTDRQGHVNNAVFATFLETGRVELLHDLAAPIADAGSSFVLARVVIDFRAEVLWPGTVEIGTRVSAFGRSSITLDQAVFQNGACVAQGQSVVVLVDNSTRRSRALSEGAAKRLHELGAHRPQPA